MYTFILPFAQARNFMFVRRRFYLDVVACLCLATTLYLQWILPHAVTKEVDQSTTSIFSSLEEPERQFVHQLRAYQPNHRLPIHPEGHVPMERNDAKSASPEQLDRMSIFSKAGEIPDAEVLALKPVVLARSALPRPCGEHVELNAHFVDREKWHTLKPDDVYQKHQQWQEFVHHELPHYQFDKFHFKGRGIVYTASGQTLALALASIRIARRLGCLLPVQVWYIGDELEPDQLAILRAMDVQPKDILEEQRRFREFTSFNIHHAYGSSRNYHIKTLVLLLTEFEEILYLDSDNMPLRDPTFLFDSANFKEMGALFWPDFWKFPVDNPIWQITAQRCEDEWEQESGQLVLDKRRSWEPLLLSMFFQKDHAFYFSLILGDKDTFRMAWKILNRAYYMEPQPPAIGGRIRQGRFCGHTMIQHGPDGEILFAHTTSMKTTNALKEGNTWEAIQYLDRVKPIALGNRPEHTRSFLVAYPQAMEFSGGIERPENRGGVGAELKVNPCLGYTIKNLTVETTQEAAEVWGDAVVDSFRIITENFASYEQGRFRWFEHAYYQDGGRDEEEDKVP